MGLIKVSGIAEKYVDIDTIKYNIRFISERKELKDAVNTVVKQCDLFLKEMQKAGFKVEEMHLEDDSQSRTYTMNNERLASSVREISFKTRYDAKINNFILKVIDDNELNVETSLDYLVSNEEKIKNELLEKAVKNARKKAEIIAKADGLKIVGVDSIQDNKFEERYTSEMPMAKMASMDYAANGIDNGNISNDLSSKQVYRFQTVNAVYQVERI